MSSKLVGAARLGRARGIKDSSIKEFKIISNTPLITYIKIQGSAKTPYTVIIDLSTNTVAHSCPDFNRRLEWCKHIGKLLLVLETTDDNKDFKFIDQILSQKTNIRTENAQKRINSLLEVITTEIPNQDKQDISSVEKTDDFIVYFARSLDEGKISKKEDKEIISRLEELFNKETPLLFLLTFNSISHVVPHRYRSKFDKFVADLLKPQFKKQFNHYLNNMWTMKIITKLELAFLFDEISQKYCLPIDLENFELLDDLTDTELRYTRIALKLLTKSNPKKGVPVLLEPRLAKLEKSDGEIYEKILMKLEFAGSHVPGLIEHIGNEIKINNPRLPTTKAGDDFLIYCIQTNQEQPKHDFQVDKYRNISYLPRELVELPATKFALYHIRESDRDYLTQEELNKHRVFFNWLKGIKYEGNWIERPRNELHDHFLTTNGIIIQWDVNVRNLFDEFLFALDENTWLIPKKSTQVSDQLQPFDYTLNLDTFNYYRPYTQEVNPKQILTPRQVIYLIKQGVKIISNLLPWEVLQRYVHEAYIASGEVNTAIKYCEEHQFIYGSIELKNELQKLIKIGKQGPAEKMYKEIHDKLRVDSGRLNMRSREWANLLLTAEGKEFEKLFRIIPIEKQMQIVVKIAGKQKFMDGYREELYKEIVKKRLEFQNGLSDFIAHVNESQSSVGTLSRKYTHSLLRKYMLNVGRDLHSESVTRNKFSKNIIGNIILEELDIPKHGNLTEKDKKLISGRYTELLQ